MLHRAYIRHNFCIKSYLIFPMGWPFVYTEVQYNRALHVASYTTCLVYRHESGVFTLHLYFCAACLTFPVLSVYLSYSPLLWHTNIPHVDYISPPAVYTASQMPHLARPSTTPRQTFVMEQVFRSYTFGRNSPIRIYMPHFLRALPVDLIFLSDAHVCIVHKNLSARVISF